VIDVPLSVLDVAPVAAGRGAGEALAHTTALARRAEELGFRRFWVAEHHNMAATLPDEHDAVVAVERRVGGAGVGEDCDALAERAVPTSSYFGRCSPPTATRPPGRTPMEVAVWSGSGSVCNVSRPRRCRTRGRARRPRPL
jgi:alkanesulfonate monooxygenase SsuD/methylene tetrahydromethanopterin reductase-like flavin-dependent oxidoreductase (luciferase family)